MTLAAQPWMKFYPQDWRADEKLRICSLAARGLWIEMLAIMHRSERYGQLLIGGLVPTEAQLAVQVGTSPDQVPPLLAELEQADVFSRTGSGVIFSRRMTRDQKRADIARKNGKKGGNPKLGKQTEKPPSDKGGVNPPDKGGDKAQRPEARGQIDVSNETLSRAKADLPEWLPPDEWRGFVAMRKQLKKPLTDRAIVLAIRKLEALRGEGHDPAAVLDQSSLKSWQDLYPVKDDQVGQRHGQPADFNDYLTQRRREEAEFKRSAPA